MIRLDERELLPEITRTLASWQAEIDAIPDYHQRVEAALKLYSARCRTATFGEIRVTLAAMCSGLIRCGYCEDSQGHQIEHIWPKSWYPELTFVWRNFLFSCGICNQRKSSRFAVVRDGTLHKPMRQRGAARRPPPVGTAAIIDPRREDPLDSLEIDLGGTFAIRPRPDIDQLARLRANHTIELLGLNDREILVEMRAIAFRDYSLRAHEYSMLGPDTPANVRQHRLAEIGRLHHRMVWEEMKRSPHIVDGFREQLDKAPELRMI
jgi:uncharacterized protein (TIGR02646 family)